MAPAEWVRVNVAPPQPDSRATTAGSPWAGEPEPEPEPEPAAPELAQVAPERRMQQIDASRRWRARAETFLEVENHKLRVLRPLLEMLQPLFLRHRDLFAVLVGVDGSMRRDELRAAFEATGITIYGDKVLTDIDDLLLSLDRGGEGKVSLAQFADMIQVETEPASGGAIADGRGKERRRIRSGAAGRPVPVHNQPSAIKAPIEAKAAGDGDALEVLFEGGFKQMLNAVGRRPNYSGERVDVRQHIDAFIKAEKAVRTAGGGGGSGLGTERSGFNTAHLHPGEEGVVWTAPSSVLGQAGISAAQDARERSEAGTGMEAVNVQNTLSEGMKFLMHAMHVKKGRLKLTDQERDAIEQLLNWDGGEIEIVRAADAEGGTEGGNAGGGEDAGGDHEEAPYDWGSNDGRRAGPGPSGPRTQQPKFTTNLNQRFFGGIDSEPQQQQPQQPKSPRARSPRSRSARSASSSPRDNRRRERPLPMLLSPRYAQQQQQQRGFSLNDDEQAGWGSERGEGEEGEEVEDELWKAEPGSYFEKITRMQLRDQYSGKEARVFARTRAEDRVILASCFEQNSAKLIGQVPSSKQRMTPPARYTRYPTGVHSAATTAMHGGHGFRRSRQGLGDSGAMPPMVNMMNGGGSALPPVTLGAAVGGGVPLAATAGSEAATSPEGDVYEHGHEQGGLTGLTPQVAGGGGGRSASRPRTRPGGFRVSRATAATLPAT